MKYNPHPPTTLLKHPPFWCRSLGTPTETSWPGVSSLQDYKPVFPRWEPQTITQVTVLRQNYDNNNDVWGRGFTVKRENSCVDIDVDDVVDEDADVEDADADVEDADADEMEATDG